MGKVSWLTHFLLEQGYEDYSFLDKAVADFEWGVDSIITGSAETPELGASFEEPDVFTSLVSSQFLCSIITISDTSNLLLLLALNLVSYSARLEHFFYLYHCWARF